MGRIDRQPVLTPQLIARHFRSPTLLPGTYEFLKYNQRHLASEVLFCASMGNLQRLKMVLDRAKSTIASESFTDYDKRTPLHVAASDGSVAGAYTRPLFSST